MSEDRYVDDRGFIYTWKTRAEILEESNNALKKKISELEAQIEKMKNSLNCGNYTIDRDECLILNDCPCTHWEMEKAEDD